MMDKNSWNKLLEPDSVTVAPTLLGCYLVRQLNGQRVVGKIVETEAYHQRDAASHSYRGQTPRNSVMFGPPGFAYVYFTYGMHYCMNVVTGQPGEGSAVLIRALEPLEGLELMQENRGGKSESELTNGPAKLCQALGVDKRLNGHDLSAPSLQLVLGSPLPTSRIVQTTRIGIRHDTDKPWRFYIKDNPFVSKLS
ncbi:MAG: DNA-3-methyladenine glycosylase [Candidatus Saccharibacteria bacterium]|nr:DNA-3-methyladenine glycosylase [Candidatus Saccharibacteria bacterium]